MIGVEEALVEEKKPVVVTEREGRLTVQAVKGEAPGTKGLAIEGDESTTTVLQSIWKADEPVKVFLGTSCIGTLTAVPDPEDAHKATRRINFLARTAICRSESFPI